MPGQTFALHIDFDSCNKIYTAQGIVQLSNKITCSLIKFTIMFKYNTSLARGTRPWTEVTTDQTSVDMFRTAVSETPARSWQKRIYEKFMKPEKNLNQIKNPA